MCHEQYMTKATRRWKQNIAEERARHGYDSTTCQYHLFGIFVFVASFVKYVIADKIVAMLYVMNCIYPVNRYR